jgi:general secretion pathway protein D
MRIPGFLSGCLFAVVSVAAVAQDSSKAGGSRAGIEIVELITRFAKSSGRPVMIDPRVRSDVLITGVDPARLSYEQLPAILDQHQFAAIEGGGMLAIVPDANARQLPSPIYSDAGFKALDHELVTLLVRPKKVCASYLVPVLRPLMPQAAHLAAEIQTNMLIISDRAGNARRIAALVAQIDQSGEGKKECPSPGGFVTSAPAPAKPAG